MKTDVIWVLVADAAGARLLRADADSRRLEPLAEYPHEDGRAKPGELVSDRPGRSFDSSRAGGRHAMEPDTELKRAELRRFVHVLAGKLEHAIAEHDPDRLVVVAGPQLLGELRKALPEPVVARVTGEVGKDLGGLTVPQLTEHLAPLLWPERGSVPGGGRQGSST